MQQPAPAPSKYEQTLEILAKLARAKNQTVGPEVYDTYAELLEPYPLRAIKGACATIARNESAFFPPVGAIVAEVGRWLRGQTGRHGAPVVVPVADAWTIARRTLASYARESRPRPTCGNPAIDGAIAALGGVAACQWEDGIGEGIIRRAFFEEYERQISTPAHIRWALDGGAARPTVVVGLEIPDYQRDELQAAADRDGLTLPDFLAAPERGAILDGRAPTYPFALPEPLAEPLTPERRAALNDEAQRNLGAAVAAMKLPPAPVGDDVPPLTPDDAARIAATVAHDPEVKIVHWRDGVTSVVPVASPTERRKDRRRAESRTDQERADRTYPKAAR